jgi:hypothetical protein
MRERELETRKIVGQMRPKKAFGQDVRKRFASPV